MAAEKLYGKLLLHDIFFTITTLILPAAFLYSPHRLF